MARNRYKLPDVTEPVKALLLPVFVPDDPGYIAAFKGALGSLAYASNWQLDQQNTRYSVADHWLTLYLESTELWTELEHNLSPLTINVNCGNCGSGCSQLMEFNLDLTVQVGQDVIDDINALPGGNVDNGYLPPVGQTYSEYLTLKCAYANQMAQDIYNTWDNLAALGLSALAMSFPSFASMVSSGAFASSLVGLLGGIVTTGTLVTVGLSAFLGIGTIVGAAYYVYFEQLQQQMSIDELRCALYGATSAEDARERVAGTFYQWGVDAALVPIANGVLLDSFVYLTRALTPVTLLEPLFDATPYTQALPVADCTLCSGVTPPSYASLLNNLVSYWEMEESNTNRADSHGSTTLIQSGAVPAVLDGVTGSAAHWANNVNNRLRAADWQPNGTGSYSIALWWRVTSSDTVTPNRQIFQWGASYGTNLRRRLDAWVNQVTDQLYVSWTNEDSTLFQLNLETHQLNTWYLLVMAFDASTQVGTVWSSKAIDNPVQITVTGTPRMSAYEMNLGSAFNYTGQYQNPFHGDIDEVAVFDRVLSQEDVDYIYNLGQGLSYANYLNP